MNLVNVKRCLVLLFFFSCNLPDEILGTRQYGIMFDVYNDTTETYEGVKIIIGGIDTENEFVVVATYDLPKLEKGHQLFLDGFDDRRWKPPFEQIKEIGEGKAYFKFQFEGEEAHLIEYVNNPTQHVSIAASKFDQIYDNDGILRISIQENSRFDLNGDSVYGMNYLTEMIETDEIN